MQSNGESTPSKSYTPLDALSSMQPPGGSGTPHGVSIGPHHLGPHIGAHGSQLSPLGRRHGCNSAFSAPPGPYAQGHHHHPPPLTTNEPGYIHGKSIFSILFLSFLYAYNIPTDYRISSVMFCFVSVFLFFLNFFINSIVRTELIELSTFQKKTGREKKSSFFVVPIISLI